MSDTPTGDLLTFLYGVIIVIAVVAVVVVRVNARAGKAWRPAKLKPVHQSGDDRLERARRDARRQGLTLVSVPPRGPCVHTRSTPTLPGVPDETVATCDACGLPLVARGGVWELLHPMREWPPGILPTQPGPRSVP